MKRSESETPLKQKKFRVFASAILYGSVDVWAEDKLEAMKKAEELYAEDRIPWNENELSDLTAEEISYKDGFPYFVAVDKSGEVVRYKGGDPLYFETSEIAQEAVKVCGRKKEDFDILKSIGVCKRCGAPLFKSMVDGYVSQCFDCDEDFAGFEQETKE